MQEIKKEINRLLSSTYSPNEIRELFYLLMETVLEKTKVEIVSNWDMVISTSQREDILEKVSLLQQNVPIQYILGEIEWGDLKLNVAKGVLIPRPETLELVQLICAKNKKRSLRILDIGTGSGCIAIALAKIVKNSHVTAWDISETALFIAKENAKKNQVKIYFEQKDILQIEEMPQFDIIVSNPPYVMQKEKKEMEENVLKYEPEIALFVPDNDPLLFYRKIISLAQKSLPKDGQLYFEINRALGKETIELLEQHLFKNNEIIKDFEQNDRMICSQKK